MTKIVLDAESFKALASDTRLQILKALDARPLTVSELSRLLDLNKATVFEHLKQLTVAELAKREDDPARKWVYYKLTWKGRNVLHPENVQIYIMLGMGALGVGGALLQTARILNVYLGGGNDENSELAPPPSQDVNTFGGEQNAPAAGSQPSGTATQPSTEMQRSEQDSLLAPAPEPQPEAGGSYWDSLQSTDFLIVLSIVTFLLLLALLVWSLHGQQRKERSAILEMIRQLPADVNADEERGV